MTSQQYFKKAQELIPGGVNSPVRAFGSVGGNPLFLDSAKGATITDVEGNTYIDFVASWGPMILGHNHPKILEATMEAAAKGLSFGAPCPAEVELAQLMIDLTGMELVRMVNSGTEATMSAIRLARGYTKRDKILKFEGCYHGHSDSLLIKSGSGLLTSGVPSSSGVPEGIGADTLNAQYNDLDSVGSLLEYYPEEVACIIVEPVAANMGVVPPQEGFLEGLRQLCDEYGTLLIFDEVITGFRLALGGAQAYFGVEADLVTYGKIIGGGMPVGAYGGRREIMEQIAPLGPVYQAGTLSGNPVAMAAGVAQLTELAKRPHLYQELEEKGKLLAEGLKEQADKYQIPVAVNQIGSLCSVFFSPQQVTDFASANSSDTKRYTQYFLGMLEEGIYLAPSQFEAMFVGDAHTGEFLEKTIASAGRVFQKLI